MSYILDALQGQQILWDKKKIQRIKYPTPNYSICNEPLHYPINRHITIEPPYL